MAALSPLLDAGGLYECFLMRLLFLLRDASNLEQSIDDYNFNIAIKIFLIINLLFRPKIL